MKDIQQLIKKNSQEGRYEDIFPKTFIDAVLDKESGVTLTDILAMFNMLFLSYNGSRSQTRLQVPSSLRRGGLWVTYVLYDKTVVTEWYSAEAIDDTTFGDSANWRDGSNALVGDISISSDGYWVINGEVTNIKAQGEAGITPILRVGSNNHLQVSYTNGSSYVDVSSNPVFTQFRVSNNKLQQSTDLGEFWSNISEELAYKFRESGNKIQMSKDLGNTWEDVSDYIAAWFRFTGTTGSSQADNVGKIQISRDNGATWSDLSGEFTNSLHIKGYVATVDALPSTAVQGDIYGVGPTYDPSDTEHTNPIYQLHVKNSTGWVNNGKFTSIAAGVVQTTGTSTTEVMSQDAVTRELTDLELEVIYDVSAHNDGAVFESLSTLLGSANLSTLIPTSVRCGGMSIRFIQGSVPNSDNKYVQYRLMSDTFSITESDWQGVDDEPTAGSDNLVKSGGVYGEINKINNTLIFARKAINAKTGELFDYAYDVTTDYIPVVGGKRYCYINSGSGNNSARAGVAFYIKSGDTYTYIIPDGTYAPGIFSIVAPTNATHVRLSCYVDYLEKGVYGKDGIYDLTNFTREFGDFIFYPSELNDSLQLWPNSVQSRSEYHNSTIITNIYYYYVHEFEQIAFNIANEGNYRLELGLYDKELNYLSKGEIRGGGFVFSIPDNAVYVRISIGKINGSDNLTTSQTDITSGMITIDYDNTRLKSQILKQTLFTYLRKTINFSNGAVGNNNYEEITDYIPVVGGKRYKIITSGSGNLGSRASVAFYTKSGDTYTYIVPDTYYIRSNFDIIAPNAATHVRLCRQIEQANVYGKDGIYDLTDFQREFGNFKFYPAKLDDNTLLWPNVSTAGNNEYTNSTSVMNIYYYNVSPYKQIGLRIDTSINNFSGYFVAFDENMNYVSRQSFTGNNPVYEIPSNVCFIKILLSKLSGSSAVATSQNDISLNMITIDYSNTILKDNMKDTLPDYWVNYLESKKGSINDNMAWMGEDGDCFVLFSDYHSIVNSGKTPSIIKWLCSNIFPYKVFNDGDILNTHGTKAASIEILQQFMSVFQGVELYNAFGNHDNNPYREGASLTPAEYYPILFKYLENNANVTLNKNGYYFFDNQVQKIRYIVLNTYGTGIPIGTAEGLAQLSWLCGALNNVETDEWRVVILAHMFYEIGLDEQTGLHYLDKLNSGILVQNIADAYQNKTQYSYSTLSADFTNAHGKMACILVGHVHADSMEQSSAGYPIISMEQDAINYPGPMENSPTRTLGTVTEQAFDIVFISTANKQIKLLRIGAGEDRTASFL